MIIHDHDMSYITTCVTYVVLNWPIWANVLPQQRLHVVCMVLVIVTVTMTDMEVIWVIGSHIHTHYDPKCTHVHFGP